VKILIYREGFVLRPGKRPLMIYTEGLGESLRARLLDLTSWLMLDGELDN
jgi:hypothetical protein